MLLQCQIVMLNNAQVSHNEGRAVGSESCRLFRLALHAVFQEDFLNSVVTLTSHGAVPALSLTLLRHSALCFRDFYCFNQEVTLRLKSLLQVRPSQDRVSITA